MFEHSMYTYTGALVLVKCSQTWQGPKPGNGQECEQFQRNGDNYLFKKHRGHLSRLITSLACGGGGAVTIRDIGRKWPEHLNGVKRSSISPFTCRLHLSSESTHLNWALLQQGLSNLSPIDHSSGQGHKSEQQSLQLATSKPCQFDNMNRIRAEDENKAPHSAVVWKVSAAVSPTALPPHWLSCPLVAPIVCQMCAPPNSPLLDVTWDGPRAEFWVISRSHPPPSIAAPFWGEGNWQAQLSRAQLPSRVDQRTENRLWIVIKPSLQNPSLPTSSCATKCLLSSSQGVSFNCQLIFFPLHMTTCHIANSSLHRP